MKNKLMYLFPLFLFFTFQNVDAAVVTATFCFDGEEYQVDYDSSYVDIDDINKNSINSLYAEGHYGDQNYKLVSTKTGKSCSTNGVTETSCPSSSTVNKFKKDGVYSSDNLIKNNLVQISYNMSARRFDIYVSSEIGDKYYIRKSPTTNENGDINSTNNRFYAKDFYPSNQFLSKRSNGKYYTSASIGENVILEFYVKNSEDCKNVFIASVFFQMDQEDDITISNPAVNDKNSSYYKKCNDKVRKNPNYLNDEASINIKNALVPVCYKSKLTVAEYNNFNSLVDETLPKLNELLSGMESLDDNELKSNTSESQKSNKSCSNGLGQTKCDQKIVGSTSYNLYANSNFRVSCTDTYEFQGDKAKLTYAGGGFEYGSGMVYSIKRSCSISFIGTPAVKPPQCRRTCSLVSTWGGVAHPGEPGGPNEDFDYCVNNCDGGNYSQSCINSCYSEVYGDDTKRSDSIKNMSNSLLDITSKGKVTNLLSNNDSYSVQKISIPGVEVPPGYSVKEEGRGKTPYNNSGTKYSVYDSGGNKVGSSIISDWCSRGNGTSSWSCKVGPSGCSWDPEGVYRSRLASIHSDYNSAKNKMDEGLSAGNITLNIVDSYLKNEDGTSYVFSINDTTTGVKVTKDVTNVPVSSPSSKSATVGRSGSSGGYSSTISMKGHAEKIVVSNIRILDTSYVSKIYGTVAYNTGNKSYAILSENNNYGIRSLNNFNVSDYYNGNIVKNVINYSDPSVKKTVSFPRYFTSLYSGSKNIKFDEFGNVSLNNDCYNIEVSVTNVGTSRKKYNFSNSCYYGLYNNYIETPRDNPDCGPNGCSSPDKDDGDFGDIKYIFRPIELTDVFPKRQPRWNWTDDASLNLNGNDPYLGYNVYPSKTTIGIEERGHTILSDANNELDYEIIIDRGNVYRIKQYNDDMLTYTHFDMNCVRRTNVNLCRSTFLDNAAYIKNAGNVRKNAKLGTNND